MATLVLGTLSVVEGTRVLLGISSPEPPVLLWLVAYNVTIGLLSVAVALAIFRNARVATPAALSILGAHSVVLFAVSGLYLWQQPVALRSIGAMVFRVTVWAIVGIYLLYAKRREHD